MTKSAFLLVVLVAAAGCSGPAPFPRPPEPPHVDVIKIRQVPPLPTDLGVLGWIVSCANITNPNDSTVHVSRWTEFYQVVGAGPAERLVLMERKDPTPGDLAPHQWWDSSVPHPVLANQTINGGSVRYAIHVIVEAQAEIYVPYSPPVFHDRWVNVTFTPFSRGTLYDEAGECKS